MRFNELIKKLKKNGWQLERTGKSSLRFFVNASGQKLILHYHGDAEVPNGTANAILKQAGIK